MGVATASGEYVDICSSEWISRLRVALAGHLVRFGAKDLDASVLQMTAPRGLTQLASRVVFSEGIAGIYYRSKYGHKICTAARKTNQLASVRYSNSCRL